MTDDPSKPYTPILNIILNHFNLAMKLANPIWNDNIFLWRHEFIKKSSKKQGLVKTYFNFFIFFIK